VIASVALGCGDSSESGPYVVEGKVEHPCSTYSVYRCWHDYSDRCRVNEATRINFDDGCNGSNSWGQNCTEIEGCVESEWLAEDSYGQAVIMNGCLNDPPPGSRTISNPSETLLSAAATSCEEVFRERREACSRLSVDDCLEEGEGCRVSTEDVIDSEQYCDTGEERQYCEYPSNITLGTFSWHLCPYARCSGDEGPYEDCLEPSVCVWTNDDESQCLPTCDLAEPRCAEKGVCQALLRRTSDGVFETIDVCVP
jgi:hypothetical protein